MTAPWSRFGSVWPRGAAGILLAALVAGGVGVATSVLSPGLGLDLFSLWLGLLPALVAALVVTLRRAWRRRFGALPSLLALSWLALSVAAHLDGWPPLPSSSAELRGPAADESPVSLTLEVEGELEVAASNHSDLYQVQFIRRGGEVGVPQAVETTVGDQMEIELTDTGGSVWYRYAGWQLVLSSTPDWALSFSARELQADLSALRISSIDAEGAGWVALPPPGEGAEASLTGGRFDVLIPDSTPVTVLGNAIVPPDWEQIDGGFRAPIDGDGWLIEVGEGAAVRIIEP